MDGINWNGLNNLSRTMPANTIQPQTAIPQGNTIDRTQQAIQNAQAMMQQFKMAGNPMQMLAQNPSYQRAMQRVKMATNPKQAFYDRARELGVNPDQFIQQLKGGMQL